MSERVFRERRQPRFDSGFAPRPAAPTGRAFALSPSRRPAAGPPTRATVKWFSPEKGFGFVALADGSGEAFLHANAVERSGRDASALKPGATLQVRIGQGLKGPQVSEILEVDESTAAVPPALAPRKRPAPVQPAGDGATRMTGTVKWYSAERGFGFVAVDSGRGEVFVHATVVQRSGLAELSEGQRVTIEVTEGRKGLQAVSIAALG